MNSCTNSRLTIISAAIAITVATLAGGGGAGGVHAFAPPAAKSSRTSSSFLPMAASKDEYGVSSRRDVIDIFANFAAGAALVGVVGIGGEANALDFDSFERGQIEKDTTECNPKLDRKCIPKLTDDEALCKYGSGGKARISACTRVRDVGGKLPESKAGERQVKGWFYE